MIARVRTIRLASGGLAPAIETLRNDELPVLRQATGFVGMIVLASLSDSTAGERVEIVSLWESQQALEAFDSTADPDRPSIRVLPLLTAPIETRVYEVSQAVGIKGGSVARFISAQLHPGHIDTVVGLFENIVMHAATEQQGFRRGLLLVDRAGNRAVSIGLWQSEADLLASEQIGYLGQQVSNFTEIVAAPIVPETLVVVVE